MSNTRWPSVLILCAAFAAVAPVQALAYDEDDGTQMNFNGVGKVHVCAKNAPMIGLDAAHNRFLCSTAFTAADPSTWTADKSTHQTFEFNGAKVSFHTCPSGQVMMGISLDKNVLICAQASSNAGRTGGFVTNVDGGAKETKIAELNFRQSVHGCSPSDTPRVMTGIKEDKNLFVCIYFPPVIP